MRVSTEHCPTLQAGNLFIIIAARLITIRLFRKAAIVNLRTGARVRARTPRDTCDNASTCIKCTGESVDHALLTSLDLVAGHRSVVRMISFMSRDSFVLVSASISARAETHTIEFATSAPVPSLGQVEGQ
ncbi:hypothetical protein HYPSUDRAFT_619883 [Hypholoma sublateritium FD-334 SS-4]|uniref:Uncharacterized protein n=1 Tax=Hypholoma sublateritium (strain FD-334 SS-4) TaxID=945553 RepID=A0A0D2MXK1_HYPSF|nr:hypothetical protein HYPSUDRAFT_619883 [Hypholoma sublateritium FD-334 SS-4]